MSDEEKKLPIVCTIAKEVAKKMADHSSAKGGKGEGIPCPICGELTLSIISCGLCGFYTCTACAFVKELCRGCTKDTITEKKEENSNKKEEPQ